MGNRILRDSICTSPTIENLSWFEEVCFYRLLVQCDDYGRMDARPVLLRSRLFPLRDDLTVEEVYAALRVLEHAGLLFLYESEGVPYLQLTTWERHQRVRNKRAKYPSPYGDEVTDDTDIC